MLLPRLCRDMFRVRRGGGLGAILGAQRAQAGARGSLLVCGVTGLGQAEQQQVGAGEGSLQAAAVWGRSAPGELGAGGTGTPWGRAEESDGRGLGEGLGGTQTQQGPGGCGLGTGARRGVHSLPDLLRLQEGFHPCVGHGPAGASPCWRGYMKPGCPQGGSCLSP